MTFLRRLVEHFDRLAIPIGRARAWGHLRDMSDERLLELGYSPELVARGVDAWPWRADDRESSGHRLTEQEIAMAEGELRTFSDAELQDLGIGRSDIPYVVRHGRPGIDDLAA